MASKTEALEYIRGIESVDDVHELRAILDERIDALENDDDFTDESIQEFGFNDESDDGFFDEDVE